MSNAPAASEPIARHSPASALRTHSRWLAGSAVIIGALNYGYTLILTHVLDPRGYTSFAASQALLLTAGTIAAAVVPWVMAYQLSMTSDRRARRGAVMFGIMANGVIGLAASIALALASARFLPLPACLALGAATMLIFLASSSGGWLQAEQRFSMLATLRVAEVVVKVGVGFALGFLGGGVTGALLGSVAGAAAVVVVGFALMRPDLGWTMPDTALLSLARMTGGMALLQCLIAALGSVDIVLVAILPMSADSAASYQAAVVLARVPLFLASSIAAVVFPLMVAARSADGLVRAALRMYAALAVPLLAIFATTPSSILMSLLPDGYDAAGRLLPWLAPGGFALGLVVLDVTFLQAARSYRHAIPVQLGGLVLAATGVCLGWEIAGVEGVAAGASAALVATAILLHRTVARDWSGVPAVPASTLLGGIGLLAALTLLRAHPMWWLSVAAIAGVVAVRSALGHDPRGDSTTAPEQLISAEATATPRLRATAPTGDAAGQPLQLTGLIPDSCLVISPHLDDAVLSCGALLSSLPHGVKVTVVTLFTDGASPSTASGRAYLRQCGYRDNAQLYLDRRREDAVAVAGLGAKAIHLGFVDALFRTRSVHPPLPPRVLRALPELTHVYPTYRFHIATGAISRHDAQLEAEIGRQLDELIRDHALVLAPLAVGRHVDHLLARRVAERSGAAVAYYADVPYSAAETPDAGFIADHGLIPLTFPDRTSAKRQAIAAYSTQVRALFPDGIPSVPETYFASPELVDIGSAP